MLPDKRDGSRPPKTRFNSRDRSKETRATCMSRLKSFPAEKIKKLDDPPTFSPESIAVPITQRDPREVFLASSSVGINCDRGDATSSELSPAHQQFKARASAMNLQQVARNHQQTDQTSPQSDSLQTRAGSSERQARRPLAANAYHEAIIRDRSPCNPPTTISQQVIVQHPATRGMKRAFEPSSCTAIERGRDEVFKCEEQPVGSQNAANYRRAIMQMQQDASNCDGVHLQGASEVSSRYPLAESRQPVYQQIHDMYHQQMSQALNYGPSIAKQQQQQVYNNTGTHCGYRNQRLSAAQLAPAQGMTSPQDMMMNQMRLTRHHPSVHQRNFGWPVGQNAWPLDGRWTVRNQQHWCQQQASSQCGCYYRDVQDTSFDRQNPENQDQHVPPRSLVSCKATADQQAIKEAHGRRADDKRTLKFTPDMIRDQELLVSTMRQQGIPHDVMHRQFDALLNEQRRHLAYVAQFQQQADTPEVKRTCRLTRRRVEDDEKPEWMVHVTPPRIFYSDLRRIKSQQRASTEQLLVNDQPPQEVGRAVPVQLQQQDCCPRQPREETIVPAVSPQRVYLQMSPHQWQQQAADWSRRGDHRTPCSFMGCCGHQRSALNGFYHQPNLSGSDQFQQGFYQYPYNGLLPLKQEASINTRTIAARERSERPTEPSSLLKMRVYKEVIRPQNRNNGLQDPDTIQRALETLKNPTSKKGLEYLANLAKKKPAIKLNGTQEADEVPEDLRPVSLENTSWPLKRISANGLENNRNPDNPAPCVSRPGRLNETATMEYPRQRQNPKTSYSATAEVISNGVASRDSAAMISHVPDAGSIPRDQANLARNLITRPADNAVIFPYGGVSDYQQVQRCCRSRQRLASHNGGQGDQGIASTPRPDAPDATTIDRAGGDALGENPSAEGTTKCWSGEQSMMPGTCSCGRPEIRVGCAAAHLPSRKPDYAPNNLAVSPDKLLASRRAQPPMIF